jgi:hypothetical protein
MKLVCWKSVNHNPCDDPQVSISIAPAEGGGTRCVFPWVLPLEEARKIFGPIVETEITDRAEEVILGMRLLGLGGELVMADRCQLKLRNYNNIHWDVVIKALRGY